MAGYFSDLDPNKGAASGQVAAKVVGTMADAARNPQFGPALTGPLAGDTPTFQDLQARSRPLFTGRATDAPPSATAAPAPAPAAAAPDTGGTGEEPFWRTMGRSGGEPQARRVIQPQVAATVAADAPASDTDIGANPFGTIFAPRQGGRSYIVGQDPNYPVAPRAGAPAAPAAAPGTMAAAAARVAAPGGVQPVDPTKQPAFARLQNLINAGVPFTPELIAQFDPGMQAAYKYWVHRNEQPAAPQVGARPQPSARTRTAVLAAPPAPTEPAPGTFDERTGTYYHGGGMWASDKPLTGEQLNFGNFVRENKRVNPAVMSSYISGEAHKAASQIAGEYGVKGHEVSAGATLGAAGISAGASKYHSDKAAAATVEAARIGHGNNNIHWAQTPDPADPTGMTKVATPFRTIQNADGTVSVQQIPITPPSGAKPSREAVAAEIGPAIKAAGKDANKLGALRKRLTDWGYKPSEFGL